jgi:hypothetical protein
MFNDRLNIFKKKLKKRRLLKKEKVDGWCVKLNG